MIDSDAPVLGDSVEELENDTTLDDDSEIDSDVLDEADGEAPRVRDGVALMLCDGVRDGEMGEGVAVTLATGVTLMDGVDESLDVGVSVLDTADVVDRVAVVVVDAVNVLDDAALDDALTVPERLGVFE